MQNLSCGIYKNKIVLVTGHTRFKGSWFCLWLTQYDIQGVIHFTTEFYVDNSIKNQEYL